MFSFADSVQGVELQRQRALLVRGVVLVQNALRHSLVHGLDRDLVSALGLGAIALRDSSVKLLQRGLERAALRLVAGVARLGQRHALLGRLDIRQTKHLLRCILRWFSTVQIGILAKFAGNCKHFFRRRPAFLHETRLGGDTNSAIQDFVEMRRRVVSEAHGSGAGGA